MITGTGLTARHCQKQMICNGFRCSQNEPWRGYMLLNNNMYVVKYQETENNRKGVNSLFTTNL